MPLKLSAYLGMEFDMGHILAWVIPILIVVLILLVIAANIKVVQQSKAMVVERLGAFHAVWGVGLHLKIPFIERIAKTISLKEQVVDFAPQPVITKDNVTMQIEHWSSIFRSPTPSCTSRGGAAHERLRTSRHHPA